MAKRTGKSPSRLEMRKQHEAAEKREAVDGEVKKPRKKKAVSADGEVVVKKVKKAAKPKKKVKKVSNVRQRRVWGIFDNSNQQVATFAYAQRQAADQKLAELQEKGKSTHYFLQPVNEPIQEPVEPAAV
jgi:hypothetical protein